MCLLKLDVDVVVFGGGDIGGNGEFEEVFVIGMDGEGVVTNIRGEAIEVDRAGDVLLGEGVTVIIAVGFECVGLDGFGGVEAEGVVGVGRAFVAGDFDLIGVRGESF